MPSLSSFLPTDEPGEAALDQERGDAAVAGVGIDVREDDEEVGFVAVGDPELAAGESPSRRRARPRASPSRTRRCPSRLPTARRRRSCRRQLRQVAPLDVVAAPAQQRVDDERVLHVDEHADRRVDARQRLDRQDGMEERRAAAAVALGDLDAHDAEVEQLVDERARDLGVLVHLADERPDLAVRELVHAVAEQPFVFGQRRQRASGMSSVFSIVTPKILPLGTAGQRRTERLESV